MAATDGTPTFALERFAWGAPDQLELVGVFSGLDEAYTAEPVLAVHGPDGERRLPAIRGADGAASADDGRWRAAFAWLEAPVAFDHARLELGSGVAVELPAPGDGLARGPLPVAGAPDDEAAAPAPEVAATDIRGAADRLRRD